MGPAAREDVAVTSPAAEAAPRTTDDIAADARQARCLFCNPGPGEPCRGINGMHLARYFRALGKQLISLDDLILIVKLAPEIEDGAIVPVLIPARFHAQAPARSSG